MNTYKLCVTSQDAAGEWYKFYTIGLVSLNSYGPILSYCSPQYDFTRCRCYPARTISDRDGPCPNSAAVSGLEQCGECSVHRNYRISPDLATQNSGRQNLTVFCTDMIARYSRRRKRSSSKLLLCITCIHVLRRLRASTNLGRKKPNQSHYPPTFHVIVSSW